MQMPPANMEKKKRILRCLIIFSDKARLAGAMVQV